MKNKLGLKTLVGCLAVYATVGIWLTTKACDMMSAPSDSGVAAGTAILLVLALGTLALLKPCIRLVKNAVADVRELGREALRRGPGPNLLLAGFVGAALFASGCGCTTVEPGHVGIVVNNWGNNRGVQDTTMVTGYVTYNPFSKTIFQYPTFTQTAVWTHDLKEGHPINEEITFTNADQLQIAADISLAYQLRADKVPAFYVKFRSDDLDKFTHGFLRNLAREKFDNIAGQYKIEQIMGDNAKFLAEVRAALQADLDSIGVVLDQFGFIGAPRPPQAVVEAINMKIKATQDAMRVENELRQAEAEAKKRVAMADGDAMSRIAQAKGEAEAYAIIARVLTPQLIEWLRLDALRNAVGKWDGHRPMVEGNGSGLLLQLPVSPK